MDINSYFKVHTKNGRQYWSMTKDYDALSENEQRTILSYFESFDKRLNPNSADIIYRNTFPAAESTIEQDGNSVENCLIKGCSFYNSLQVNDGNWGGDYGGPLFLLPGLVIASHVTKSPFENWQCRLMSIYIKNHQNEDGGWGLHIEGNSTMFGSVMNYVALRLLGEDPNAPKMILASNWIKKSGGATLLPSWGKFYLSILGLYEWEGNTSLFPEAWLLPKWLPFHPSRFWCHTRMVYLPMAFCYGNRYIADNSALIQELKTEIYPEQYHTIKWNKVRTSIAASDSYYPTKWPGRLFNRVTNLYETIVVKPWRKKSLDFMLEYINAEDEQTNFIDIGPVNQVLNSIAVYFAYGKESVSFQKHKDRWKDYLWIAEDGMKMQGYNGSQLWDTGFYAHALTENDTAKLFPEVANKMYQFIDHTQVKEEVADREKWFRHESKGGWPFSTIEHGWPITDCTALGLSAAIQLEKSGCIVQQDINADRKREAIDLILGYQNSNGSWSTYELQRSPLWMEQINPAEVFGEIMVDFPHIECSSSCLQVLLDYQEIDPTYRSVEINKSIEKGIAYVLQEQEDEGGWYGNWAVCFTYGTWFALEALNKYKGKAIAVEKAIEKACNFLLSNVHQSGGWGESFESCVQKKYVQHQAPQIVNTSWALLALMGSGKINHPDVVKGILHLQTKQLENGDFPQEGISGVFNHNCMITYTSYRNVFPLWALARYVKLSAKQSI